MSQDFFGPDDADEFGIDDAPDDTDEEEDPLGLDGLSDGGDEDEEFDPGGDEDADADAPDLPPPEDEDAPGDEGAPEVPEFGLSLPQVRPIPVQPEMSPPDPLDPVAPPALPPARPQKYYITRGRTYAADAVITEDLRQRIVPEPRPTPDPAGKHYVVCRRCRRALPCPNKQLAIRSLACLEALKCDCGSNRFYTPIATDDLAVLLAQSNTRARVDEFDPRSIEEIRKLVTQSVAMDLLRAAKPPQFNPTTYTPEMIVDAVLLIAGPTGVRPTAIWRPYEDFYRAQLRLGEYQAVLKTIEDRSAAVAPPTSTPQSSTPAPPPSAPAPPPSPPAQAQPTPGNAPDLPARAGETRADRVKMFLRQTAAKIKRLGHQPPPPRELPPELEPDADDNDEESGRVANQTG